VVDALGRYVERLFALRSWAALRRDADQNTVEKLDQIGFHFFPRRRVGVVEAALARLGPGDAVLGCVSHIDDGPAAASLAAAAARGVRVSLHLGRRGRRVSDRALRRMHAAGAEVRLYGGPAALPMHCKFLVLHRGAEREALFGSFNLNTGSRWFNHEVLCRSAAPSLVDAFEARFHHLRPWAEPAFKETCL
jgi:phosphatidylserine/phosphatidylglycerophosphate/cardiolipin synthase-like enzyme